MAGELAEYVLSQKGKNKLIHGGYSYSHDRTRKGKSYWKCSVRKCNGRAIVSGNYIVSMNEHSSHAPNEAEIKKQTMMTVVRAGRILAGHCKRCIASSATAHLLPLNYLNGERIPSTNTDNSKKIDVLNPATGQLLCTLQCSGDVDVDYAVTNAKQAFGHWSELSGMERGRLLSKAAQLVKKNKEEFAKVEVSDTGKPIWEARCDIDGCIETMEYYAGLAPSVAGQHLQCPNGSFGYTRREPLGVCGGIGAWNYPFQMATWKSAPALACGNTMVFKPSPFTPLTAVMLAEVYTQAGLPPGCFNIVQGHAETGQLMCVHPDIAKMSLTGSVAAGTQVMKACAESVKHVTLELGGKSPLLIFDDCDLDNAVKGAMMANYLSQGQVCSNGTRVFVHNSIFKQFLKRLVERTKAMKIGDPTEEDTTVGATISEQQAEKVLSYVQSAKEEGATVLCGGERVYPGEHLSGGYFISPCVLSNVHDNMRVVQEEVFGSVVSVLSFDTEEEVIQRANNTIYGLAGGIFTKDLKRAHRVAAKLQAGAIYINNYNVYPAGLPFGGYKCSGIGRENGPDSLDYFTQIKAVYVEMGDVDCPL